ncbi:hypothetical protein OAJ84_03490 [Candidatus Puniceispirillum sp.]|nr:hypothetical protein [Candidatus Puniceispirillum sp.]
MKHSNHIRRYAIWLSLVFTTGIPLATSASHATTQIIVYQEPVSNNKAPRLADVAADAFKSRLNQMNFMVLDTATVSRKVGINASTASRNDVMARLPSIRSNYGDVLIIFLQSWLHLPASRNAYLQSNATVVSSATESQIVSSSIDGEGFLLPRDCDLDCSQILGTRASRQIAETLAMRIGKLLNSPSGSIADAGNPINKVAFDLVNFNHDKQARFIDLLINEFPGFLKIVNMQQAGPRTRFSYFSEAPNEKLQKWISISLRELGINPETGADIMVKPGAIQIVLTTTNKSRGSIGNPLKYN